MIISVQLNVISVQINVQKYFRFKSIKFGKYTDLKSYNVKVDRKICRAEN